MKKTYTKGFGLLEVLIASTIITIGILAISTSFTVYIKYALSNDKNVQAAYLAQEGFEVMGFLRDKGWASNVASISTTTPFYLTFSSTWTTTTSAPAYIDSTFLRQLTISDVRRDVSDNIVTSGGIWDPYTKKVTLTVSYFQGKATTTQTMSMYISKLFAD